MKIILAGLLSFGMLTALSQPPRNHIVKSIPLTANKLLFKTTLGNYSDSATITVDEAAQLITTPIKITDDKKNVYAVTSYGFVYKSLGVTENEEMDKVSPASSMVSSQFSTTPLPEIWTNNIKQQLKPGEELYFFDVVIKNAQGKLQFVPGLKIRTK